MMKWLFLIGLIILMSSTSTQSHHQVQWENRITLGERLSQRYLERVIIMGLSSNGNMMELFSNGRTWTIIETRPDLMSRFMSEGGVFQVVRPTPPPIKGKDS